MVDRALTFADPQIVKLLKEDFIPVAIDQWFQRRQQDAEGKFYRKVAGQGPRANFDQTTQGRYVCTPDGKLLGYNNNRGSERVLKMMKKALEEFDPSQTDFEPVESGKSDPQFLATRIPEGAAVVRVTSKVLGGYEESEEEWKQAIQTSTGRDNLVLTQDDVSELLELQKSGGEIPISLAQRIARFHLVDNTRGEAEWWRPEEIKQLSLTIDAQGAVKGSAELVTDDGKRGFTTELAGIVEFDGESLTRFDLVANGTAWGRGRYTRFEPKGDFPFAVSFRLADGSDPADRIAPHATKGWGRHYYK